MRASLACLLLSAVVAPPVGAAEWRTSGYATLGSTQVRSDTARGFARDQSQSQPERWEVDSRLGLQLDGELSSQVGVTTQLLLRPRVPGTSASESVEWAFLHWTPSADWKLRLGRTSPDLFLFADVRSVGIAYPWVRPNQEFYAWMPVQSVDGLDITRSWSQGDALWRLKLGAGHGATRVAAQDSGTAADAHVDGLRLISLTRETPTQRLKFSYTRTTLDLSRAPVLVELDRTLAQLVSLTQPVLPGLAAEAERLRRAQSVREPAQYLALGWQQDWDDWQLTAEWSRSWGPSRLSNGKRSMLSVAKRWEALTLYATAGRSRMTEAPAALPLHWAAQLAPLVGPQNAAQATLVGVYAAQTGNLGRADQRSAGFGARWDLSPSLALKAQWERVNVAADGRSLWRLKDGADGTRPFRADVLSFSLDTSF